MSKKSIIQKLLTKALRGKANTPIRKAAEAPRAQLRMESFEDRIVPATYNWDGGANLSITLAANEDLTINETGGFRQFAIDIGAFNFTGTAAVGDTTNQISFPAGTINTSIVVNNAGAGAGTNNVLFAGGSIASTSITIAATQAGTSSQVEFTNGTTTVLTGTVALTSTAGGIVDNATGAVTVNGALTLTAPGTFDIVLDNPLNNFSFADSVTINNANNAVIADGGNVRFANVTTQGNFTVTAGAQVDLNGTTLVGADGTGNMSIDTNANAPAGGPITGAGQVTVNGTTLLDAGPGATATNDITLNNTANNFVGVVTITAANDVSLDDANAIGLGLASVTGNYDVDAGGLIDIVDVVTVGGNVDFASNANNAAGGPISDNGAGKLMVTGTSTFNSGPQNITVDNTAGDLGTGVTATANVGAGGNITLADVNGLAAINITTTATGDVLLISGGPLSDADGATDITGDDLMILVTAGGGVGTNPNPLQTVVSDLDVDNVGGGGIFVSNTGALTLSNLNLPLSPGANGKSVSGVGGGGQIRAGSPLVIAADAITSGGMTYTAADSAAAGDNLTINANVTVQDTTGALALNAGDNLVMDNTSTVNAATTLTINLDATSGGTADAGVGTSTTLNGSLIAGTTITVNGFTDSDSVTIASGTNTVENIGANLTFNGGGGAATDTLSVNDSGDATADGTLAAPVTISNTGAGAGTITGLIDANAARTISFAGLVANSTVNLQTGNTAADVVQVTPNANVVFNLDGNNPAAAPGDVLIYDGDGVKRITGTNTGQITGTGVLAVNFQEFEEVRTTAGKSLDDIVDLTLIPTGQDGTANTVTIQLDPTSTFLQVFFQNGAGPNTLISTQLLASVKSVQVLGGTDADTLVIDEVNGLPSFAGTAIGGHTVNGVNGITLGTTNPGIHFNGGTGVDTLRFALTQAHDVRYFSDTIGAVNSGNVEIMGKLLVSFEKLAPLVIAGAGGSVLADASANASVTTMTVNDTLAAADGISIVTGNGSFESMTFSGFATLAVRSGPGADTIDLVTLDSATTLTNVVLDTDNFDNTDASNDTVRVRALPATVTATLLGGAGNDLFLLDSTAGGNSGTVSNILGQVLVSTNVAAGGVLPAGAAEEGGTDVLYIDNFDGAAANTAFLDNDATSPFISGVTGAASPAVRYNFPVSALNPTPNLIETVNVTTANNFGDTVNVRFTSAGSVYYVNTGFTGAFDDTVNIGSTAPVMNTGTLNDIDGQVNVSMGASSGAGARDTLNVSDFGDTAGDTYTLDEVANITRLAFGDGAAALDIRYNVTNITPDTLTATAVDFYSVETFNLVGANDLAANNTYNILATTGTVSNTIDDGDATATGAGNNAVFTITGDNLSGANLFRGFDGNDKFVLNIATNIGANDVAGGDITGVTIEGGAASDTVNRDKVTINDNNAGFARSLNYQYKTTQGDIDIAPFAAGKGLFGADGLTLQIRSSETLVFNNTGADNDTVRITGTANDDVLTVSQLADNAVGVFLNGTPYLDTTAPTAGDVTIANSRPGLAGGGTGIDMLINGITPAGVGGLSVDGGGKAVGDKLVVYASSENNLTDVGNATDIFGFGAGVLIPAAAAGDAYDTIVATDAKVTATRTASGTPLTTVNIVTASFDRATPPVATEPAALTVNAGDEAGFQPSNIADNVTATISANFNIQINGNLPGLTFAAPGAPDGDRQGDQLVITAPGGALNVFSDNASTPNVTVTSTVTGVFGIRNSSIERLTLDATPTGIVNLIGDNNVAGSNQIDQFIVRGRDIDGTGEGVNEFSLIISGNKPGGAAFQSAPIFFNNVTRMNVSGAAAAGFDAFGNAIPLVNDTAIDTLEVTPYADNTPRGWGVETYFNEGGPVTDGDLLIYNGVLGVSESIVVAPSASQAGQVFANNAATGTPIAVINYVLNTNIVVNGSSPAGTVGDTDALTLRGTDPSSPGTSGNDTFVANFTLAGTPANEVVQVTDGANPLYNIQSVANFNTITLDLLGGNDSASVVGRNDGSLTVNVVGGAGTDTIALPGLAGADTFSVTPGASPDAGVLTSKVGAAGAATVVNFTGTEAVTVTGAGGGDTLTVNGTGADDTFTLTNGAALAGTTQTNAGPVVTFTGVANVGVVGGAGTDTATITGTAGADAFVYTATGAASGTLTLAGLTHTFTSVEAATVDGLADVDTLNVATANAVVVPGSTPGSGTIYPIDAAGAALLPLAYSNVETVTVTGGTVVVQGTSENDTITVSAAGIVTVTNPLGFSNSVNVAGFATLVINALGGDDTVTIAPSALFAGGITVIGGEPGAGSDTLAVTGADVVVNLATSQITGVVGGPITFTGVEDLNVTATATITVLGQATADNLAVTPTGANTATIVVAGMGLTITTDNPGTLTIDGAGGQDSVTVNGTAGNDTITVTRGATTTVAGTLATKIISITSASTEALTVAAGSGDDTVNVVGAGGPAFLAVDGGPSTVGDTLSVTTSANASVTFGNDPAGGVIGDAASGNVNFVNAESLTVQAGAAGGTLTINGTTGNDAITQIGAGVTVNNGKVATFGGYTNLTLNGLNGNDAITVDPAGLPAGTVLTVDAGTGSDLVTVLGTAAADAVTVTPDGAATNKATVAGLSATPVTVVGSETLSYDGQDGDDALTYQTPAGLDILALTPGALLDEGTITGRFIFGITTYMPLTFSNLGGGGTLTFAELGGGRNDDLTVNGTAEGNLFQVDAAGQILLSTNVAGGFQNAALVPVNTPGVNSLNMLGLDGDDVFTIVGNHPFAAGVLVGGGNPSASDVVNFAGAGGQVDIDLNVNKFTPDFPAVTLTEAGFGGVSLVGVEVLNATAAGGAINVLGTVDADAIAVTPTGANTATLTPAGLNLTINTTNTGVLTVDTLGGNDQLTVNGTAGADAVAVTGTNVTITGLKDVAFAGAEALRVNGASGTDTFTVTPSAVNVDIDGGDPLGSLPGDKLVVTASAAAAIDFGPNGSSGVVTTGAGKVSFTSIEGVTLDGAGAGSTLVINGTNADNAINQNGNVVTIDAGAPITFTNFANVNLNGLAGKDTITINPTGLPAGTVENVDGGDGADSITVVGTAAPDAYTYTATGETSGTLVLTGQATFNITNTEAAAVNALDGADTLNVTTVNATVVPSGTPGSGTVFPVDAVGAALLPLAYSNVETVTVTGGTAVIQGTSENDIITVTGAGIVTVTNPLGFTNTVDVSGFANLVINSLSGDDTISINSTFAGPISVIGGANGSGSDSLTVNGADVVIDLGAKTITGVVGGPVSYDGIEHLSVVATGTITVNGRAVADTIAVTPTGATTALIVPGSGGLIDITTDNPGTLTINGAGGNDAVVVNGTSSGDFIGVDRTAGTVGFGGGLKEIALTSEALTVAGGLGDDFFLVTGAGGPAFLTVDGGLSTTNDFVFVNTSANASVTYGADVSSGVIGDLVNGNVGFANVETLVLTGAGGGSLTINGTNANDAINQAGNLVTVNNASAVNFGVYATLNLNGLSGADAISVTPATLVGVATVNVDGGDPVGTDTLTVTSATPTVNTATNAITGAAATINYAAIEALTVNAGTSLTVSGSADYTVNPGAQADSGTVQTATIPVSYTGLTAGETLTLDGTTVVVNASNGDDTIAVGASSMTVAGRATVATVNVTTMTVSGLDGDDTFNVAAGHGYATLILSGGNPSASDVANLTGDGTAVTVDLAARTVTGGGLGTVSLVGVEHLNLNAGAGNILVTGTANADAVAVTPTGANSASITVAGLNLTVGTSNTGTLTVDTLGGGDQLTVNGSAGNDTIAVTGTNVTITGLKDVIYAGAASLRVNGASGSDTFNVTPAVTNIVIDGGDPIGTLPGDVLNVAAGGGGVTFNAGPESDEGGIVIAGGANPGSVSFDHIESIGAFTGAASATINGTNGNDALTVIALDNLGDATPGVQDFSVSVNNGLDLFFIDTPIVNIDGKAGSDQMVLRAPAPNGVQWNTTATFKGGTPSASGDSLVIETPGVSVATYNPTAADGGSITIDTVGPAVFFSEVEAFTYDGEAAGDTFSVSAPGTFVHTPGTGNDEGTIRVDNLLAVTYQNLGLAGTLGVIGTGGADLLVVQGTAATDFFNVDNTGVVGLNARLPLTTTTMEFVALNGFDGDDTFTIAGDHKFAGINVDGGNPSASDVVNFNGSGANDVAVSYDTNSVSEGGVGVVFLTGVETLNAAAGAKAITVAGTGIQDVIGVTPTGATTAAITNKGSFAVNTANTGVLTITAAGGSDEVTVFGSAAADVVTVDFAGGNTKFEFAGLKPVELDNASTELAVLATGDANDVVTLTGGDAKIALMIDAGSGGKDKVSYDVSTVATVTQAAVSTSGTVAAGAKTVDYAGLETLAMTSAAAGSTLTVRGTDDNDTIAVGLIGPTAVWINDGTVVTYGTNFTDVVVQGRFGADAVTVTPHAGVNVTVQGGDPTNGDSVVVNTAVATTVTPTAVDGATVQGVGLGLVTLQTVSALAINGLGAGVLTVAGTAGADTVTVTPGAANNAGAVSVNGLLPVGFQNLGAGTLTVDGQGGGDTLVVVGTANSDVFGVDVADVVSVNARVTITPLTFANLALNGLDGDDTFNVAGNQPLAVAIDGGNPSASDVVNFNGSGGAVTVDLAAGTVTEVGTVSLVGVETLNANAAGGAIAVNGSAGADAIAVTPTGANTATVQDGSNLVVNTNNTGTLTIDTKGGGDQLTVNGTAGNDTVAVTGTNVTITGLKDVAYAGVASLRVNGASGSDTFNVTPSATEVVVDGGDPIGTLPGDTLNLVLVAGADDVTFVAGPQSDEGSIMVNNGAIRSVSFDHIETIGAFSKAKSATILGSNGNDALTIIARDASTHAGTDGVQDFTVTANSGPELLFIDTPVLNVDALAGSDQVMLRAPAPNGAVWNVTTKIEGGAPAAAGDSLVVETPGTSVVTYDAGAGTLAVDKIGPAVAITGFESFVYDGGGKDDSLTVVGTAKDDAIVHTPGAADDAGTIAVNSLLPISYQNLGKAATLTVDGLAGTDDLEVLGTAGSDTFGVAPTTGAVTLNGRLAIASKAVEDLTLDGLGGIQTFNVALPQPFTTISVDGGSAGLDSLNVTFAAGVNETFTLVPAGIPGAGRLLAGVEIAYTAIATPTVVGNAGDVDALVVNDDGGDNLWTVIAAPASPLVVSGDRVVIDGRGIVDYDNFTNVTLNNTAGTDRFVIAPTNLAGFTTSLTVNGDAAAPIDDVLELWGTAVADNVTSAANTISMNGVAVTAGTNLGVVIVNALGGDDNVNLSTLGVAAQVLGGDGNDTIVGTPQADLLDGGAGNDTVVGGAGIDTVFGGTGNDLFGDPAVADPAANDAGNDLFFGGDGSDTLVWDSGDGSDTFEGGEGEDVLRFNGNAKDEVFTLNAVGTRAELLRSVGAIDMDLAEVEQINLATGTGLDAVAVNDLTGTAVKVVNVNLGADGAADAVTVNGTPVANNITVSSPGAGSIAVFGLPLTFNVTGIDAAADKLAVDGAAGDDVLTSTNGADAVILLTLAGGAGNDSLIGEAGDETFLGGAGDDTIVGGGSKVADLVDGGTGADTVLVDGTNGDDVITLTLAAGNLVAVAPNGTTTYSDLTGTDFSAANVERILVVARDGSDAVTLDPIAKVNYILEGGTPSAGPGDAVAITGTAGADAFGFIPGADSRAGTVTVAGKGSVDYTGFEAVSIDGGGAGADKLTFLGTGGNDITSITGTAAKAAGVAQMNGSVPIAFANFGAGSSLATVGGGGSDDVFVQQGAGWLIPTVTVDGGLPTSPSGDTVSVVGTAGDDLFTWTPSTGTLVLEAAGVKTTYLMTTLEGGLVDGLGGKDKLSVTEYVAFVPTPGSGKVPSVPPLYYQNMEEFFIHTVPVAAPDAATTLEDTPVTIDVVANDTAVGFPPLTLDAPLTLTVTSGPTFGTVTVVGGKFVYTPNLNANGTDKFTYQVADVNNESSTAVVTVTVTPVNDQPTADDQALTVAEDNNLAVTLTGGDADPELVQTLTFAIVTPPTNGTLVGFNPATGQVTYVPNANFNGADSFTFTVTDDALAGGPALTSRVATVGITVTAVNDTPTFLLSPPAATAGSFTVLEDQVLTVGVAAGVLNGLTVDVDGDKLTASLVSNVQHGTLVLNPDGSFVYTPFKDYSGPDAFTFKVSDGKGGEATGVVAITVVEVFDEVFMVGAGTGGDPVVRIVDGRTGTIQPAKYAFNPDTAGGGARVAAGDFNGDGTLDFAVATGPGTQGHVRIVDGKTGATLFDATPFEQGFTGGINISAGDVNGDKIADLVVTPDEGGGARVQVYTGGNFRLLANWMGIDDPAFRGGARAAIVDINGDGFGEVVVAAGFTGGPRVTIWDGKGVALGQLFAIANFFAFEETLRDGVFVAGGDVNNDGFGDLVLAGGPNGGPRIRVVNGRELLVHSNLTSLDMTGVPDIQLANFFVGDPLKRGGVHVAARDLDDDQYADIIAGDGTGVGTAVTVYSGRKIAANDPTVKYALETIPGFIGGVNVG